MSEKKYADFLECDKSNKRRTRALGSTQDSECNKFCLFIYLNNILFIVTNQLQKRQRVQKKYSRSIIY